MFARLCRQAPNGERWFSTFLLLLRSLFRRGVSRDVIIQELLIAPLERCRFPNIGEAGRDERKGDLVLELVSSNRVFVELRRDLLIILTRPSAGFLCPIREKSLGDPEAYLGRGRFRR